MRKVIIILTVILSINISNAQNDTIYLEQNYLTLNGLKMNQIIDSVKTGMWIDYEIFEPFIFMSLGSGPNYHVHEEFIPEYRALKPNEKAGVKYLIESKCDTIEEDLFCHDKYKQIENKIPSNKYKIVSKGKYDNNRKENLWTYFHLNGKIKKEIFYVKGLPLNGFKIYTEDQSLLMELKKLSDMEWKIIKYSDSGEIIESEMRNINDFKELY